ncbi:porin family protein [Olivibacter sitiensis]|uniref:porin family protein n=1 Tax=Olivibacter sitiensis TaxID=376470 RepID=UPI0003FA48F4|nr:porin family protein [Olivibacter sitiensis]
MKKIILSIAVLIAGASFAQAQLLPSFQFGLKGGLNFSKLSEDGRLLNSSTRTGYQAGVYARVGAAGIHFQPELYVTGKSSEATFNNDGNEVTANVTFTSLDLPLLIGTRIGLGPLGFRVQAGPVVSFMLDKGIGSALSNVVTPSNYKNQAIGITGGIGADVSKLRVDLRYEHGLSDLSKDGSESQKLSLWTLGIGYRLF